MPQPCRGRQSDILLDVAGGPFDPNTQLELAQALPDKLPGKSHQPAPFPGTGFLGNVVDAAHARKHVSVFLTCAVKPTGAFIGGPEQAPAFSKRVRIQVSKTNNSFAPHVAKTLTLCTNMPTEKDPTRSILKMRTLVEKK